MRYTFNMVTMMKEKVNTHFSFPLRLDMTPYTEDFLMGKNDRKEGLLLKWIQQALAFCLCYILCIYLCICFLYTEQKQIKSNITLIDYIPKVTHCTSHKKNGQFLVSNTV